MIKAVGTPGASRQITVPLRTKLYLFWNAVTTYDMTVAAASGDSITVTNGNLAWVFCDGTNVELASPMFTTTGVLDMKTATGLSVTNSNFIVGNGTTFVVESGATAMTSLGGIVTDTTPQLGGALDGQDNTVSKVNLKDYGEVTNAIGGTGGGTQDIDLTAGNSVSATVDTSTNTFTFSDPTASDELCGFTLTLVNGGSQTVNWPGSVDWAGGSAPTLTTSGTDILTFFTINGGTLWHGMIASADSK
jgi:hypothetical protein